MNWLAKHLAQVTLGLALGVVLVQTLVLGKLKWAELKKPMGPPKWNFSESWGSTLALVSGILGAFLADSNVVPEPPEYLSRATYGTLNVLFVVVMVLGPLFYASLQSKNSDVYTGYVGCFLLATILMLCGALGELLTVGFLLIEIGIGGALSGGVLRVWCGLVLIASILLCLYVWNGIKWRLDQQAIQVDGRSEPRPSAWSIF